MKGTMLSLLLLLTAMLTVNAQGWQTDFSKAKEIAAKEDKPIILVFQGSDWCAPCIKLDREIWTSEVFKKYAEGHFVMFKADFPRRKKNALPAGQAEQNAKLAETYNQQGIFPLVVVLDNEGKILGETGYKKMNPDEYIVLLESFNK